MIVTRSPLRITLGGGGTDLPVYYKHYGGQLIAATINKYVYITVHESYTSHILKYSDYEVFYETEYIRHPIFKEVFKQFDPDHFLEICSMADVPAGTGLGSSGAFTCALLLAMHTKNKVSVSKSDLAEGACHIEIDLLGEPIGKQDQYASAFGGFNEYTFNIDGSVDVKPLKISMETTRNLTSNLLMFSTGFTRSASKVLSEQQSSKDIVEKLHQTKQLGIRSKEALLAGDLDTFGTLMHEHWMNKRSTSISMSNDEVDKVYDLAMQSGALGGKLIGAGGGGFLMFYTNEPRRLRNAMSSIGVKELDYAFESLGTQIIMV